MMFGHVPAGADWERAEVARRRAGTPVVAVLKMNLQLPDRERADLARHLATSALMARRAHESGGYDERTAQIVTMLEKIAEAAGSDGPAEVGIRLDSVQCRRVRGVLRASQERAGDLRGAGDAIARIITAWERCTGYSAQQEAHEAARPPRVAAEGGGWVSA